MSRSPQYITIGDWSEDGHNSWDVFAYTSNRSLTAQRKAFVESTNKSGLSFTRLYRGYPHQLCADYQNNEINAYHIELMRRHLRIDSHPMGDCGQDGFYARPQSIANLAMFFIERSLPGFKHTPLKISYEMHQARKKNGADVDAPEDKENIFYKMFTHEQSLNGWWGSRNAKQVPSIGYGTYEVGLRNLFNDGPKYHEKAYPQGHRLIDIDNPAPFIKHIRNMPYELRIEGWKDYFRDKSEDTEWEKLVQTAQGFEGRAIRVHDRVFFESKKDATLFLISMSRAGVTIHTDQTFEE